MRPLNDFRPQGPINGPLRATASPVPQNPAPPKQDVPVKSKADPHFVQAGFLLAARRSSTSMEFTLKSGLTITGRVIAFDQFSVAVEANGKTKLLYKHAVECIQEAVNASN